MLAQQGTTTEPRLLGGMIAGAWAFYRPFFEPTGDGGFRLLHKDMQEGLKRRLDSAGGARFQDFRGAVVVSLGLASEPLLGTLSRERFDFGTGFSDTERHFLSSDAVDRLIDISQTSILEFYRWLHCEGYLVAALAGPAIQKRHRAYAFYGDRIKPMRARFEAPVRSYLDMIGCPIVEPLDAFDDDGFLLERYYGDDWSHGNAEFGALMLRHLDAVTG